jgi:hypothetical protein
VSVGDSTGEKFAFSHPYGVKDDDTEKLRAFAEQLVRDKFGEDHVADLDWENCVITDEC